VGVGVGVGAGVGAVRKLEIISKDVIRLRGVQFFHFVFHTVARVGNTNPDCVGQVAHTVVETLTSPLCSIQFQTGKHIVFVVSVGQIGNTGSAGTNFTVV